MRTALTAAVVIVALLLTTATMAVASDFCFSNGLVLKAFSLPGKGACKEYRGLYPTSWVSGAACGSSDGDHVSFAQTDYSSSGSPIVVLVDRFTLNRASGSGSGVQCEVDTGAGSGGCSPITTNHVSCSPATLPVP